jgi:formate dehydrogenase maturation protein FdhE
MMLLRSHSSRSNCLHCEAHVPSDFRRVHGDGDDRAHRCPECDSWSRIFDGSAAGKDVSTPDPETSPARNAGEPWDGGLSG